VRGRVLDDLVVSEDPVFRLIESDEREEVVGCSCCVKDPSPIEASCRRKVLGYVTAGVGLDGVVARAPLVVLDSVAVRLTPFRPLPNVVTAVVKIGGGVLDGQDVWMVSGVVEDVERSLESLVVTEDDVVMNPTVFVGFLDDFEPSRGKRMEEVGEFIDGGVLCLRIGQKKPLPVSPRSARH